MFDPGDFGVLLDDQHVGDETLCAGTMFQFIAWEERGAEAYCEIVHPVGDVDERLEFAVLDMGVARVLPMIMDVAISG